MGAGGTVALVGWAVSSGSNRPRLCKNVFDHTGCPQLRRKSRFYAKSWSADL